MDLADTHSRPFGSSSPDTPLPITDQTTSKHLPQEKQQQNLASSHVISSPLADALAGTAAGAISKTAMAPLERVKLLMQLRHSVSTSKSDATGGKYSSALGTIRSVWTEQGVLSFWRGNLANVVRQAGTAGMNLTLMDHYRSVLRPIVGALPSDPSLGPARAARQRRTRDFVSSFLSGGLAGGTATTVLYPLEFMRTRLAMDVGSSPSSRTYPEGTMRNVFCLTLRSDGARGLYQGYGVALCGVVVYRALHLGGYDIVKSEIAAREGIGVRDMKLWKRFAVAQAVSLAAGTFCYPIDSVRRRLMMQSGLPVGTQRLYTNATDCFRKIFKTEGVRGFYLGIGPNLWRSFGGALLLVAYDEFKGMIY